MLSKYPKPYKPPYRINLRTRYCSHIDNVHAHWHITGGGGDGGVYYKIAFSTSMWIFFRMFRNNHSFFWLSPVFSLLVFLSNPVQRFPARKVCSISLKVLKQQFPLQVTLKCLNLLSQLLLVQFCPK